MNQYFDTVFDIAMSDIVRIFQKCHMKVHNCKWHSNDTELSAYRLDYH
ncbi:hypothetical protein X798_05332 [Onchocerca flexuosa]|uniref:Uncharacterized protein n=1 Tax=Onchocerca flexuosa TaxID=387005 RepID=A0A238BS47_9BILA|nr:hypothetical protein X798_05332 [Onchocerca flexuosa]